MAARRETLTDQAVGLLRELLADGPRPATEVLRLMHEADVRDTTLRRAKERAGVVSRKLRGSDGAWMWELPAAK